MLNVYQLNQFIKEKKLTNKKISQILSDLGVKKSETAIQKYRKGINDPDTKTLSLLADILDVTEQDLFVGADKRREKIAIEEIRKNRLKYIHLLETDNPKNNLNQVEFEKENLKAIYIDNSFLKKSELKNRVFAFTVVGDSMSPYLNNEDIVLYKKINQRDISSDGKYVINTSVGLQVKNLIFLSNGNIKVMNENISYSFEEIIYKVDIIGVVIGRVMKD